MKKIKDKYWIIGGIIIAGGLLFWKFRSKVASAVIKKDVGDAGQSTTNIVSEIKIGDDLYPKFTGTNIRTEPIVNNGVINNIIEGDSRGLLGTVVSSEKGPEDGMTWYKIKLAEPKRYYGLEQEFGFVRIDVVKKG